MFVPLNTATTYEKTKRSAHALAERLEREHPDEVVSRMQKVLRKGKVLIDWSQNDEHKTTVNVYSLRAKERPTVSTPVRWQEVDAAVKTGDPSHLIFDSISSPGDPSSSGFQRARPTGKSHLGGTGVSGHDLPAVIKLLQVHGGVAHDLLLGNRESDRPPSEG